MKRVGYFLTAVILSGSCFSSSVIAGASPPSAAAVAQPRAMTPEEADDWDYLLSHIPPDVPYKLNPAQMNQKRHILRSLEADGHIPSQSPAFHKALGRAVAHALKTRKANVVAAQAPPAAVINAASNDSVQDINMITIFTSSPAGPGQYSDSATALSSVVGGTAVTAILLELADPVTKQVYASNSSTQYYQGTNDALTLAATMTNPALIARATINYTPLSGPQKGIAQTVVVWAGQKVIPTSPCMTAPNFCSQWDDPQQKNRCLANATACTNTSPVSANPITVCYSRTGPACDYYNPGPAHPTNFVFPTAGNVNFSPAPLNPVSGNVTSVLQDPNSGGGCILETAIPIIQEQWTVSGNTLAWNINPVSNNDPTGCLNHYDGKIVNFGLKARINLDGKTPSGQQITGEIAFSSDKSLIVTGVSLVPQLNILEGCLAAGTRVRLADKGEEKIENFKGTGGETVVGAGGIVNKVIGTSSGVEPYPMIRISAAMKNGRTRSVLLTRTHPVMTPGGAVLAKDLKKGDKVLTIEGIKRLRSVRQEMYGGRVHNIQTVQMTEAKTNAGAFYADGFLVGDIAMQNYYVEEDRRRKETDSGYLRKTIPSDWQEDYKNYLERKKQ